jgi:hypothetical protein
MVCGEIPNTALFEADKKHSNVNSSRGQEIVLRLYGSFWNKG